MNNREQFSQYSPPSPYRFGLIRNLSISTVSRNAATIGTTDIPDLVLPAVPKIPSLTTTPDPSIVENVATVNALGEPSLTSLGIGSYSSPSGLVQNALEAIHIYTGLPWWGTIAVSTVVIRMILTPLVISAQRNSAVFCNSMDEFNAVQEKMTEARQSNNTAAFHEHTQEMQSLMAAKGYNPLKNILVPFAQMPFFLSFYFGIRGMVNAPVESMQHGGMSWFTDLTAADPLYILPLITCGTLWLTMNSALATTPMTSDTAQNLTLKLMKFMPVVMFPFIMSFPSALVVYWASSNTCALLQVKSHCCIHFL